MNTLLTQLQKKRETKEKLINQLQKERKDVSQMSKEELKNRAIDLDFLLENVWIKQAEIKYSFVLENREIIKRLQEFK